MPNWSCADDSILVAQEVLQARRELDRAIAATGVIRQHVLAGARRVSVAWCEPCGRHAALVVRCIAGDAWEATALAHQRLRADRMLANLFPVDAGVVLMSSNLYTVCRQAWQSVAFASTLTRAVVDCGADEGDPALGVNDLLQLRSELACASIAEGCSKRYCSQLAYNVMGDMLPGLSVFFLTLVEVDGRSYISAEWHGDRTRMPDARADGG